MGAIYNLQDLAQVPCIESHILTAGHNLDDLDRDLTAG